MNTKKQPPQKPINLHQLFESTCNKFGDRLFIWDKWNSNEFVPKSYSKFSKDVQTFAAYLIDSGFSNKNVLLFSENSYFWLVVNYAITAYVGRSVAANKDWQDYDVANVLKTVDIDLIIYSNKNKPIIEKVAPICKGIKFISMKEVEEIISKRRAEKHLKKDKDKIFNHIIPADKICQIIFTTGSSGLPKAVPLSFSNMEVCFEMMLSRLPFCSKDTHYLFLPLHHVFGNMAAMVSFRQGHKLYLCSDTSQVKDEIKIAKPTIVCGVPLFFDRIYNAINKDTINKINKVAKITGPLAKVGIDIRKIAYKELHNFFGGKLKYIICGAAPLEYKVKKLFLDIGVDFVEAYGMSETSAFITMEKLGLQTANSVGIPYDAVTCKLVDTNEFGQGEVVVKGPNVFKGYFKGNRIEKSAADSEGFFHTGDLGRFDDQGRLFLTGRKKRLILTSNGENVSPDELEKHFGERLGVKKVKIYTMDNQIAATIYLHKDDNRTDKKIKSIITQVNHGLPKFKRIHTTFIDHSGIDSGVK